MNLKILMITHPQTILLLSNIFFIYEICQKEVPRIANVSIKVKIKILFLVEIQANYN